MAWNEYRLSDVIHLIGGGTPKTSNPDYWGGDIPWLSVGDFNNGYRRVYKAEKSITEKGLQESSTKILKKGQLIISARGTVGVIAQLGRDMAFNQTCYGIDARPDKSTNDFLYYLVKDSVIRLKQITHGAIFDTITRETFNHISVKLPPLPEQKAIASILGALDDKIELNRKMNETLEAMARAIFKSWFVDFDPIPGLGPHKDWHDSPLGKIPKGWRVVKVSDAFEINPSRPIKKGTEYAYVDMASLPTASARVTDVAYREFTGSGSKFKNGDILFARITPCLENGKTALVDFLAEDEYGWGSTEFIVLSPKQPLNIWFAYCVARDQEFRNHAIRAMSGTSGRQRVELGCFNNYSIVVPSAVIAAKFGDIVDAWFKQIKANDEQSFTLATIRDALLPKLLSGEIRVKDAERFVERITDV